MNPPDSEGLAARIGQAVRNRRKAENLTLTQVAQRADISVSHLSNLETGFSTASLLLLARVAGALNTSLAELTRGESRLMVEASSLPALTENWRWLSHAKLQTQIVANWLDAGARVRFPLPLTNRDLFLTVLRGTATVTVDSTDYTLDEGDAIDVRHALVGTIHATSTALILCSTTPHTRA